MATEKMTKKDYFVQIKANYNLTEDEIAFIDHEVELLSKKSSGERKPSARQIENDGIKNTIVEAMDENVLYSIGDMLKKFNLGEDMSSQRLSALVSQLVDEGKIVRTVDKRKAFFSLA